MLYYPSLLLLDYFWVVLRLSFVVLGGLEYLDLVILEIVVACYRCEVQTGLCILTVLASCDWVY